jgi:hypothetical protein
MTLQRIVGAGGNRDVFEPLRILGQLLELT